MRGPHPAVSGRGAVSQLGRAQSVFGAPGRKARLYIGPRLSGLRGGVGRKDPLTQKPRPGTRQKHQKDPPYGRNDHVIRRIFCFILARRFNFQSIRQRLSAPTGAWPAPAGRSRRERARRRRAPAAGGWPPPSCRRPRRSRQRHGTGAGPSGPPLPA